MNVVVLQSFYIPWKGYFDLINEADKFCFYDEVKYVKNFWINRNKLYSKNGLFWLTIPVSKDAVNNKISEVKLSDTTWQTKHYKSILQTYKKAPYFESFHPILKSCYLDRQWTNIAELNKFLIKEICRYIKIETEIYDSINFQLEEGRIDRLRNLVLDLGGTTYISGPAGKNYLDPHEKDFSANGIKVTYKSYEGYVEYSQNKMPFEHGVSILDVLSFVPQEDVLDHITANKN